MDYIRNHLINSVSTSDLLAVIEYACVMSADQGKTEDREHWGKMYESLSFEMSDRIQKVFVAY